MPQEPPFAAQSSFLGSGWSFPPEFAVPPSRPRGVGAEGTAALAPSPLGRVLMTSDEADINASLRILLGTSMGERFLNPEYGLDLRDLLFDPLSVTFVNLIKDQIKVKILVYEARIEVLALEVEVANYLEDQNQGIVRIHLDYIIRSTNSRYNLVYPFYLSDGSEVRPERPALLADTV